MSEVRNVYASLKLIGFRWAFHNCLSFMNMMCPYCQHQIIHRKGFYRQKLTRKYIQRFLCMTCNKYFSSSTLSISRFQKKPFINTKLFELLCSGVSIRRSAKLLNVSYFTAYRRFLWLSSLAATKHAEFLSSLKHMDTLFVDEMESIEHTKLKPLTLPIMVNSEQQIIGLSAGAIPAKGHLAHISEEKYGKRENSSSTLLKTLFMQIPKELFPKNIISDAKSSYPKLIQERFPGVKHDAYSRSSKERQDLPFINKNKRTYDPMFPINQRCAKLRSDIKRLVRRSWCTTKKIENLVGHLQLYACYNNGVSPLSK